MKEVFLIKEENKTEAENKLKGNDLVSKGSITFTQASNLDFDEDGYFCIVDTSEEGIEKAKELLKNLGKTYDNKEDVIKKQEQAENNAAEAFGNILG